MYLDSLDDQSTSQSVPSVSRKKKAKKGKGKGSALSLCQTQFISSSDPTDTVRLTNRGLLLVPILTLGTVQTVWALYSSTKVVVIAAGSFLTETACNCIHLFTLSLFLLRLHPSSYSSLFFFSFFFWSESSSPLPYLSVPFSQPCPSPRYSHQKGPSIRNCETSTAQFLIRERSTCTQHRHTAQEITC